MPILGKGAVEEALKEANMQPIFMVDIAVPEILSLKLRSWMMFIYTVDDLEVIGDNIKARQTAADLAQEIVDEEVAKWSSKQRELAVWIQLRLSEILRKPFEILS